MRIAITGASGFLGRHVAAALVARGETVTILARPGSTLAVDGSEARRFASPAAAARHVAGFGPDVLIHLAAAQGRRGETAAEMVEANVTLGAAMLEAMAPGTLFINAGTTLPPTVNLYALTKHQFAAVARMIVAGRSDDTHPGGARVADAQFQMIYGPGDDQAKFVPSLAQQLVANAAPLVTTPATQRRDFLHVDDAVAALLTLADARATLPAWQDVPVGSGRAVPLGEVIARAIASSGFTQRWDKTLPPRPGEPAEMVSDLTVLRALGWTPRIALDDGIADLLADTRARAGKDGPDAALRL